MCLNKQPAKFNLCDYVPSKEGIQNSGSLVEYCKSVNYSGRFLIQLYATPFNQLIRKASLLKQHPACFPYQSLLTEAPIQPFYAYYGLGEPH
jgi:hypothetical protein